MDFLKSITGKIVTGAVALAVVAAGISWWQMEEATREMLVNGTGKILAWLGIVLVVPWAMFFVIGAIGFERGRGGAGGVFHAGRNSVAPVVVRLADAGCDGVDICGSRGVVRGGIQSVYLRLDRGKGRVNREQNACKGVKDREL
jgi:hypothetical protein